MLQGGKKRKSKRVYVSPGKKCRKGYVKGKGKIIRSGKNKGKYLCRKSKRTSNKKRCSKVKCEKYLKTPTKTRCCYKKKSSNKKPTRTYDDNDVIICKNGKCYPRRKRGSCTKRNTKTYRKRNSPPYSANEKGCQRIIEIGNDGNLYESTRASNGVYRWIKQNN